jgi:transcriptional regulator with XRE-family HTH domain
MKSDQKPTNKLKDLRTKNKKTQRQLAEALGLRSQTISDWECGVSVPGISLRQASILCHELNCTIHELADAFDSFDQSIATQEKELVAA